MQASPFATSIFGAATLLLGLMSSAVLACDCDTPPAPKVALKQADAVFAGKVLDVQPLEKGEYPVLVRVQVEANWKGADKPEMVLQTGPGYADCGFPFETGRRYLIYAFALKGEKNLIATICSRTKGLADAQEDLDALGPGLKP